MARRRNSPTIEELERQGINVASLRVSAGAGALAEGKKPHKYRANALQVCPHCWTPRIQDRSACVFCYKTPANWEYFDSKGELTRWCELVRLEKANEIHGLQRQVPIPIEINGVNVGVYRCDYVYRPGPLPAKNLRINILPGAVKQIISTQQIYEDYKGFDTPLSRFKRKCVEAAYFINIILTGADHHDEKEIQTGRKNTGTDAGRTGRETTRSKVEEESQKEVG